MNKLLQLLLALLISYSIQAQSTWTYYSNDHWLQDIQVVGNKVCVGSPTGLHILDIESGEGEIFQSVNSPLRGSFIWEILAAEDHIWVALNEGGVAKYTFGEEDEEGSWEQYYTPVSGDNDTLHRARRMMEAKDGTLWFDGYSDGRGAIFSLKNGVLTDYSDILGEETWGTSLHGDHRIYYKDSERDLHYYDVESATITKIEPPAGLVIDNQYTAYKDEVYVNLSDSAGSYLYRYYNSWTKINDGGTSLSTVNKGANRMWTNSNASENPTFTAISPTSVTTYTLEDIAGSEIEPGFRTSVFNEDSKGRIWLSRYNFFDQRTTVYSIKDELVKSYDIHHSSLRFVPYSENTIDFDCDGNLIIADLIDVQVFNPDTVQLIKVLENREHGDLQMVATDPTTCRYFVAHDGQRYGSDHNYLYVFENHKLVDTIYLESGWLGDILIASDGQLYVENSDGAGLYDWDTEEWKYVTQPFYNPEINRFNSVLRIAEHKNGIIGFGTGASLVLYDGDNWTTYDKSNSPIGNQGVYTHLIDSKGDLLVEYDGGIYKYDGQEWEYTAFFNPYRDGIASIYEDEIGNYWLGTYNSGLLYWNGFDYQQFDIMNSAIPSNKIIDIIPHPHTNDLWLLTDRGIAVFDRDNFTYKKGIFGKTYYDAEQDLVYDAGIDVGLSGIPVYLDEEQFALSDVNGNYALYPEEETDYKLDCKSPDSFDHTSSSEIELQFENQDILNANFGLWKQIETEELEVDITLSPFICSSEISAWITIKNPGWNTVDGQATIMLPDDIRLMSTYPDAVIMDENSATWNFTGLSFQEERSLYAIIQGPSVAEILASQNNIEEIIIPIKATLEYEGINQEIQQDEQFLCSYDPNDKISTSVGPSIENYSLLNDDLVYTIRFQNEGNYKATDVVLVDTIDNQLDLRTIEVVSSSHYVQTQVNRNREVIFRFMGIDLPPKSENEAGSQGFVKFKISPQEDLPDNSVILNEASIYFDSNAPIITNTTENILVEELPSSTSNLLGDPALQFNVYPNPSSGQFIIETLDKIKYSYRVIDGKGIVLSEKKNIIGKSNLELKTKGLYFITVNDGISNRTKKIIVQY